MVPKSSFESFSNYSAAATSSLKKLNIEDSTEGDDSEQSNDLSYLLFSDHFSSSMVFWRYMVLCFVIDARRNSMLEAIEREFEGYFHITLNLFAEY